MDVRFGARVAIVTGAGLSPGPAWDWAAHSRCCVRPRAKMVVNDPGGAVDGTGGASDVADRVVAEIRAAGGGALANHDFVVAERRRSASGVEQTVREMGAAPVGIPTSGKRNNLIPVKVCGGMEGVVAMEVPDCLRVIRLSATE